MLRSRAGKVISGLAAVAALVLLAALLLGRHSPASARPALPSPNGYEDLLAAGGKVKGSAGNYARMSQEELGAFVAANQEALRLGRIGLGRECAVPWPGPDPAAISSRVQSLVKLRELGQLFCAEARLAELEGGTNRAVACGLDIFRLGLACGRGGLLVDSMVGVAIQRLGLLEIERNVGSLGAAECRRLAASLEKAEADGESMKAILAREEAWSREVYGWSGEVRKILGYKARRTNLQRATAILQQVQTEARALSLRLAARAFAAEKGAQPGKPSDLVPEYLKAVPRDPTTDREMAWP